MGKALFDRDCFAEARTMPARLAEAASMSRFPETAASRIVFWMYNRN